MAEPLSGAEPTEKGQEALALAIAQAWAANPEKVYPPGAEFPDPQALADIAASAAWAFFFNVVDAASRKEPG